MKKKDIAPIRLLIEIMIRFVMFVIILMIGHENKAVLDKKDITHADLVTVINNSVVILILWSYVMWVKVKIKVKVFKKLFARKKPKMVIEHNETGGT